MAQCNRSWSVASVFNDYGMFRYEKVFHQDSFVVSPALQHIDEQRTRAESVADCIRNLGYTVLCGGEDRGRYVISQINKKRFYYGSAFGTNYQYLSGKRTIYEMAIELEEHHYVSLCEQGLCRRRSYNLLNISGEIAQKKIKSWIEDGSLCNKNVHFYDIYEQGVSTIGNTLPGDIVQALQDFTSDCPYFVREPDYEFYIPHIMQELPDACPPPEFCDNKGSGTLAEHAAQAAPETTTSKKTPAADESSDSDDDC